MVKHTATIQGDPSGTYRILTDFARYMEWYPECEKLEVASTNGSQTDVNLTLGGMKIARMVLRYECRPELITYNMVSSQDLKGFTGSYKIIDGGNGTHTVMMEVDLSASVPKFVTDRMMKSSLEKQAKQLQERNARFSGAAEATTGAAVGAASSGAPTVELVESARPRRSRCVLRVRKSGDGVNIWYAGSEYSKGR